jgi:hypothetical protein
MISGTGFYCSSYINKTTRTFEHRGEAWRVLVGAKVESFFELCKFLDIFFQNSLKYTYFLTTSGEPAQKTNPPKSFYFVLSLTEKRFLTPL